MTTNQKNKKTAPRKSSNKPKHLTNEQLRRVLEEGLTVAQVTGKAPMPVVEKPVFKQGHTISVVHCKVDQDGVEYIGRPSVLGNKFTHKEGTQADVVLGSREEAVAAYRVWLNERIEQNDEAIMTELNRLAVIAAEKDLKLACWCAPKACHGDVIKEVLESMVQDSAASIYVNTQKESEVDIDMEELKSFDRIAKKVSINDSETFEEYLEFVKMNIMDELKDPDVRTKYDPSSLSTDEELMGMMARSQYDAILARWKVIAAKKNASAAKAKMDLVKAPPVSEDLVEESNLVPSLHTTAEDDPSPIILTPAQEKVVSSVKTWYMMEQGFSVYQIGGYAGVGKSTVIERILRDLPLRPHQVRLVAPTGTASLVIQEKTPGYECSTLHKLFYKIDDTTMGKPTFVRTDDNLVGVKLIILDEGYMAGMVVGTDMEAMCEKAGVKLLVTGDPGQLEPVNDKPYFLMNPDAFLDEVMRQAKTNPIIAFSMKIREATKEGHSYIIPNQDWNVKGKVHSVPRARVSIAKMAKNIKDGGVIICGLNKTRVAYNKLIRTELGFTSDHLMDGEYVTVKANIMGGDEAPVTNGMRGKVSEVKLLDDGFVQFRFTPDMFTGSRVLKVKEDILFERKTMNDLYEENDKLHAQNKAKKEIGDNVRLGYVITAHAAQGAQWKTVYFFNESWVFNRKGDPEGYKKANAWLYTVVTRAIDTLVVLR